MSTPGFAAPLSSGAVQGRDEKAAIIPASDPWEEVLAQLDGRLDSMFLDLARKRWTETTQRSLPPGHESPLLEGLHRVGDFSMALRIVGEMAEYQRDHFPANDIWLPQLKTKCLAGMIPGRDNRTLPAPAGGDEVAVMLQDFLKALTSRDPVSMSLMVADYGMQASQKVLVEDIGLPPDVATSVLAWALRKHYHAMSREPLHRFMKGSQRAYWLEHHFDTMVSNGPLGLRQFFGGDADAMTPELHAELREFVTSEDQRDLRGVMAALRMDSAPVLPAQGP